MKNQATAALFGAALLLAGAPALADMSSGNQMIRIESSNITPVINENNPQNDGGSVHVVFTNENSVPATDVVFALEDRHGGALQTIHDRGTFSPGATIDHVYSTLVTTRHLHVAVVGATFADGTKWRSNLR